MGVHGALHGRGEAVAAALREAGVGVMALGQTKDGHPRHPLYLAGDSALVEYVGGRSRSAGDCSGCRLADRAPV